MTRLPPGERTLSSSYLQKPVAPSVKRGDDGGMDVAAVQALGTQKERKQSRVSAGNHRPRRGGSAATGVGYLLLGGVVLKSLQGWSHTLHQIRAPQCVFHPCSRLRNSSANSPRRAGTRRPPAAQPLERSRSSQSLPTVLCDPPLTQSWVWRAASFAST